MSIVAIWFSLGAIAFWMDIRRSLRFNRAIALKYRHPMPRISAGSVGYAVAFGVLGPLGIVGSLSNSLPSIAGEPYWTDAR